MKRVSLPVFILLVCVARMTAEMGPSPQISLSPGTSNTWNLAWSGRNELTYFSQWSSNLVAWNYLPDIEHGTGLKASGFTSTSSKFFFRLFYTDIPTNNPELADFDLDGLGNRAELDIGTDPFASDSDHDGIPDGAEVFNGGNPLADSDGDVLRAVDSDGDGVSDAIELVRGTSPTLWDSDGDGFSDANDDFPLDPTRHTNLPPTAGDTTKPTITLDAPANATFVFGP